MPECQKPLVDPDGKMNKYAVRGSTTPSWNMHGLLNKGPDPKSINVLRVRLAYSGLKYICQSQLQSYFQLASQVLLREKK